MVTEDDGAKEEGKKRRRKRPFLLFLSAKGRGLLTDKAEILQTQTMAG